MNASAAKRTWRIGTRGSQLAQAQARWVEQRLGRIHRSPAFELVTIRTRGDVNLKQALPAIGGKGLFTVELEQALHQGRIDLAVHSAKDLPTAMPPGLTIGAVPRREQSADVLITRRRCRLAELPAGALIGTSSLRRQAQLLAIRADLKFTTIRGNIDTRIAKVERGDCQATVLAAAGLKRCGLFDRVDQVFDIEHMIPAAAQGALAVQCRADDQDTLELLAPLDHAPSAVCVSCERQVLARLEVGCQVPLGVLAVPAADELHLRAVLLSLDGRRKITAQARDRADCWSELADRLAADLHHRGQDLLRTIPSARQGP